MEGSASEAVHVAVAAAGLAALFTAAPVAFTVVRVAGAAYLIYLGVQLIRHRKDDPGDVPAVGAGISGRRAYLSGLLTNLLNPKMVVFTIAFLPQFINPQLGRIWLQFAILGAIPAWAYGWPPSADPSGRDQVPEHELIPDRCSVAGGVGRAGAGGEAATPRRTGASRRTGGPPRPPARGR